MGYDRKQTEDYICKALEYYQRYRGTAEGQGEIVIGTGISLPVGQLISIGATVFSPLTLSLFVQQFQLKRSCYLHGIQLFTKVVLYCSE